jgi:outer membrane lipase/esterase
MTPKVRAQGRKAIEEAHRLTDYLNRAMDEEVGSLTNLLVSKQVRLWQLDVWSLAKQARGHQTSFDFKNVTAPCKALRRCEGHLFWDDVHPTTDAHARLADAALTMLAASMTF